MSALLLANWQAIAGFAAIYTVLLVIEMKLMLKTIRKGPEQHAPVALSAAPATVQPA